VALNWNGVVLAKSGGQNTAPNKASLNRAEVGRKMNENNECAVAVFRWGISH